MQNTPKSSPPMLVVCWQLLDVLLQEQMERRSGKDDVERGSSEQDLIFSDFICRSEGCHSHSQKLRSYHLRISAPLVKGDVTNAHPALQRRKRFLQCRQPSASYVRPVPSDLAVPPPSPQSHLLPRYEYAEDISQSHGWHPHCGISTSWFDRHLVLRRGRQP